MFNQNYIDMRKVKIQRKLTKEQKQLLIALLLGDGTISNNYVFKLCHAKEQEEYLNWKIQLLNKYKLKNNGLKTYKSTCGYNTGKEVIYSQLSINPTIKALRRSVYIPQKTITRKMLDWLNPLGLAIWYMDDGFLNINSSNQRSSVQHTVKITTCVNQDAANIMINYFNQVWQISFRAWEERPGMFSLATRSELDTIKFLKIVKPYIIQVPSLLYKIRKNGTKAEFLQNQQKGSKCETLV